MPGGYGFFRKQQRDWRIAVYRSNTHIFMHKVIDPYLSIYIVALGATATQLGLINSIGMIIKHRAYLGAEYCLAGGGRCFAGIFQVKRTTGEGDEPGTGTTGTDGKVAWHPGFL